ncbi:hypothetical protein BOTBODRAFT_129393 [Botryobasidium botryosum FD-172 SS1]|uniref:FAD/NAD(P)-binding domain-containing protein n=1 Tax=Botryobasidium botryosum (strain FD-172 SS1) TaxID=930990 RepID=A0A067MZW3_BOTB1|nr:hypothetical protein BOTBODRAFT_129393 [Botryobasidium botryosum FD-172 SS1]
MTILTHTLLATLCCGYLAQASSQIPLIFPASDDIDHVAPWSHHEIYQQHSPNFEFKRNITRVAIIGAGVGGLISYREFKKAGYEVRLFERDSVPGGNWRYTEESFPSTPYPPVPLEVADYTPSFPPKGAAYPYEETYGTGDSGPNLDERIRDHRAPKPVWATLVSNAPSIMQQVTELPWPVGTAWELLHSKLGAYLRAFASFHGANSNDENPEVSYSTRVEQVKKIEDGEGKPEDVGRWRLTLKELRREREELTARWWTEDFDAVVVATGRYNAPSIPSIPGLESWAARWSNNIWHSRQYRRPELFANKTVLVIGAATSGMEIARDLAPHAKSIYTSSKTGSPWLAAFYNRVPRNVTLVPEIESFLPPSTAESHCAQGSIKLANGTVFSGIDHVIFATGYHYTFPFLSQYHDASLRANETAKGRQPIVTDGTHLRSLYLDLFYIEEPTLAFINMNTGMQSFTYAEYLAVAAAKVWKGDAHIPAEKEMWARYWDRVQKAGGHKKGLQILGTKGTEEYIRYFVAWLNAAPGRTVDLPPAIATQSAHYYGLARFGFDPTSGAGAPVSGEFLPPRAVAWDTSEQTAERKRPWAGDLAVLLDSW